MMDSAESVEEKIQRSLSDDGEKTAHKISREIGEEWRKVASRLKIMENLDLVSHRTSEYKTREITLYRLKKPKPLRTPKDLNLLGQVNTSL